MSSIRETNDKFYMDVIAHYKSIGDEKKAKEWEESYQHINANRKLLEDENQRILKSLLQAGDSE